MLPVGMCGDPAVSGPLTGVVGDGIGVDGFVPVPKTQTVTFSLDVYVRTPHPGVVGGGGKRLRGLSK